MKRRFVTLDVFTQHRFSGNQLAIVLDGAGLNTVQMQAIASEFNLSETVFLSTPNDENVRAHLRIFTPLSELSFAGHPTIGTAVLIAMHDLDGKKGKREFNLNCAIGTIKCSAQILKAGVGRSRFCAPVLPTHRGDAPSIEKIAQALGLEPVDIGYGSHSPSRYGVSGIFDFIPISTLDALKRIKPIHHLFDQTFGERAHQAVYVYTNEPQDAGNHFHARMFAPQMGINEDPATGSAAIAFAAVLQENEHFAQGQHHFVIEQGYEIGRPSQINLTIDIEQDEAIQAIHLGGSAIVVSNGFIRTP